VNARYRRSLINTNGEAVLEIYDLEIRLLYPLLPRKLNEPFNVQQLAIEQALWPEGHVDSM